MMFLLGVIAGIALVIIIKIVACSDLAIKNRDIRNYIENDFY